eukprot:gene11895-biopygen15451
MHVIHKDLTRTELHVFINCKALSKHEQKCLRRRNARTIRAHAGDKTHALGVAVGLTDGGDAVGMPNSHKRKAERARVHVHTRTEYLLVRRIIGPVFWRSCDIGYQACTTMCSCTSIR